jgi:hypothetical protein
MFVHKVKQNGEVTYAASIHLHVPFATLLNRLQNKFCKFRKKQTLCPQATTALLTCVCERERERERERE